MKSILFCKHIHCERFKYGLQINSYLREAYRFASSNEPTALSWFRARNLRVTRPQLWSQNLAFQLASLDNFNSSPFLLPLSSIIVQIFPICLFRRYLSPKDAETDSRGWGGGGVSRNGYIRENGLMTPVPMQTRGRTKIYNKTNGQDEPNCLERLWSRCELCVTYFHEYRVPKVLMSYSLVFPVLVLHSRACAWGSLRNHPSNGLKQGEFNDWGWNQQPWRLVPYDVTL